MYKGLPRMALSNDNHIGYVSDVWVRFAPRWIEMAAATPVWTSLMAFYVEEDKGHLMGETMFCQKARSAVRGSVASFHMHWEQIFDTLLHVTDPRQLVDLPHNDDILAQLVRFEFKLAAADLSHHLKDMRLRAHVVLRLGWELIEKNHPAFGRRGDVDHAKQRYAALVSERYPTPIQDQQLPECERQGVVPPAVAEAITFHTSSAADRADGTR